MASRRPVAMLLVLATVLLALGLPLEHVRRTTRPTAFADHAAALLDRPVVRAALTSDAVAAVTDAVVRATPVPRATVRAAVAPRVPAVVRSRGFRTAWRSGARAGLRQLVDERRTRVDFAITGVADLTSRATGPLPAALEAQLRAAGPVTIFGFDRRRPAAERTARAERLSALGTPALVAAAALALLALLLAPSRRAALVRVGLGAVAAGVLVVVAELTSRAVVLSGVGSAADRSVVAAVWDELLAGLRAEALVVAAAGIAVAGVAAALRPAAPVRRATRPVR